MTEIKQAKTPRKQPQFQQKLDELEAKMTQIEDKLLGLEKNVLRHITDDLKAIKTLGMVVLAAFVVQIIVLLKYL